MHIEYTAVVKQQDDWWIGWMEEIPGLIARNTLMRS